MKKIITISSVLMLIAVILPSCGMNVVKRQHNGGYYISKNKGYQHSKNEAKQEENTVARETIRPETSSAQTEVKNEEIAVADKSVNTTVQNENTIAVASTEKAATTAFSNQSAPKKSFVNNNFVNKAISKIPMTKKMKANVKSGQDASARGDGLSFFWIVILILLLLYIFGVTGHWFPGGLIHVLLVIALVLLILWLLGVV